jgi:hypothetical protein
MKTFRFILRILLKLIAIILVPVAILLLIQVPAEQKLDWNESTQIYQPDLQKVFEGKADSLSKIWGGKKSIPEAYSLQCLIALSAFPELKNTEIHFILSSEGYPMQSSIYLPTLVGAKEDRVYKIMLNDSGGSFLDPILLKNLPFDAQVAILIHEIGHTAYYEKLSTVKFLSWGLKYALFPSYRKSHESSTDRLVIYRGFGYQLLNYARFVRYADSTNELYQEAKYFMNTYYLTPYEIQDYINKLYNRG